MKMFSSNAKRQKDRTHCLSAPRLVRVLAANLVVALRGRSPVFVHLVHSIFSPTSIHPRWCLIYSSNNEHDQFAQRHHHNKNIAHLDDPDRSLCRSMVVGVRKAARARLSSEC
jgi:hypothetical protein